MFKMGNSNLIAICDLFYLVPMDFQLDKLAYSINIFNFRNILINKLHDLLTFYNAFNTAIANLSSVFSFLLVITFNSLIKTLKIFQILKTMDSVGMRSHYFSYKYLYFVYFIITNIICFKHIFNFLFLILSIFKSLFLFLKTFNLSLHNYFKKLFKLFFEFFNNESSFLKFIISFTLIKRRMIM